MVGGATSLRDLQSEILVPVSKIFKSHLAHVYTVNEVRVESSTMESPSDPARNDNGSP